MQKNRVFITAGIIVIALIALFGVGKIIQSNNGPLVKFETAPADAQILANNKLIDNKTRLKPGEYNLIVQKDNYETYKSTITISAEKENTFAIVLLPVADLPSKDLSAFNKRAREVEKIGGALAQKNGQQKIKENPIIDVLPYINNHYRIDYSYGSDNQLIITISANTAIGRYLAITKIISMGFNPTNYTINFADYKSPFNETDRQV